jgi:P4 family phage/plasmid primase-like protien
MNLDLLEECLDNSIIGNINKSVRKLNIKTIKDFKEFKNKKRTEQSNIIIEHIKKYLRAVGDDKIYYYNENTKLWAEINKKQYDTYIYDLLLNTTKQVEKLMTKENIDMDERIKLNKFLDECFDNKTYVEDIIKRSFTKLYNSQFLTYLNSYKEYLPLQSGKKINLRNLQITDREYNDYFTYECPVDYVESTPHADKYFNELWANKEEREFVRKYLGYCMTGETSAQKFAIWYGFGSNSKGILMDMIESILKIQYVTADESIFIKNKKSQGQATPEIMALMGKRFCGFSEGETADNVEMNESSIKRISGEDTLTGRPLYCSQVEFKPYCKLNLATNYVPALNAEDAMKRRLLYIFFDIQFKQNPTQKNHRKIDVLGMQNLKTKYLSEIFSWIAKGAVEYYKDLTIEMPKSWRERTDKILSEGDSIECFIKRKIVKNNKYDSTFKRNELFDKYREFCGKNSQRCITRSTFWARIEQNGVEKRTKDGYDVFYGIEIKEDEPDDNGLDYGIETEKTPAKLEPVEVKQTKSKSKEEIELEELEALERELSEMK